MHYSISRKAIVTVIAVVNPLGAGYLTFRILIAFEPEDQPRSISKTIKHKDTYLFIFIRNWEFVKILINSEINFIYSFTPQLLAKSKQGN